MPDMSKKDAVTVNTDAIQMQSVQTVSNEDHSFLTPSSNSSGWVNSIEREIKNEGSTNGINNNFKAQPIPMGIPNNLNFFNSMNQFMPNTSVDSFKSLSLSPTSGSIKTPNQQNLSFQSLLNANQLPLNPYSNAFSPLPVFNNNHITPLTNGANGFNFPSSTFPTNTALNNQINNMNLSTSPIPLAPQLSIPSVSQQMANQEAVLSKINENKKQLEQKQQQLLLSQQQQQQQQVQATKVNVRNEAYSVPNSVITVQDGDMQHSRSITVNFLTMYYNALHTNPSSVKRFYHLKAQINRNMNGKNLNTNSNNDLSGLENVLFVDIDNIVHQSSIDDAILIRVNGTMKFIQKANKKFDQTFIIKKNPDGFWLVHNDIFILIANQSNDNHKNNESNAVKANEQKAQQNIQRNVPVNSNKYEHYNVIEHRRVAAPKYVNPLPQIQQLPLTQPAMPQQNVVSSYSNITAKAAMQQCNEQQKVPMHKPVEYVPVNVTENVVNKRMVNKFYHDASYQNYDNDLAIFIRGVPKSVTHSKLCGILSRNLLKNANGAEVCIDYIDVNYHKQFAFVYFGNEETLDIALRMGQIYINNHLCQIQRKRSHNGPRKFLPKRRQAAQQQQQQQPQQPMTSAAIPISQQIAQ